MAAVQPVRVGLPVGVCYLFSLFAAEALAADRSSSMKPAPILVLTEALGVAFAEAFFVVLAFAAFFGVFAFADLAAFFTIGREGRDSRGICIDGIGEALNRGRQATFNPKPAFSSRSLFTTDLYRPSYYPLSFP